MLWVATMGGLLVLIGKAIAKDAETPTTSDCQNSPHRSKAEEERLRNEQRDTHKSMFTRSDFPMF